MEEIRLAPLSRDKVAEEIAALVGGPPPTRPVEEVYTREWQSQSRAQSRSSIST